MKKSAKHLLISIVIMLTIVFISIPIAFAEIEWAFPILTFLCRLDVLYFIISIIMCISTYNPNPNKEKKVKEDKKTSYYYHTLDINNGEQDTKKTKETKKKFTFKTEQDRLYEEATKYFGKAYVKYRDKASVVEEYLEEEGSMWKK